MTSWYFRLVAWLSGPSPRRSSMRWRKTKMEKRYNVTTYWEMWKPNFARIFICSWKGHDDLQKFGGAIICRRCT